MDTEKRKIACKDADGVTFETGYDHLVIATGSQVPHHPQCQLSLSGWVKQGTTALLPATSVCMIADACMWLRRLSFSALQHDQSNAAALFDQPCFILACCLITKVVLLARLQLLRLDTGLHLP